MLSFGWFPGVWNLQTECSETSAYKFQMPGNHPKESIQHICLVWPWSLFIVVRHGVTGSVICLMFNLRMNICIDCSCGCEPPCNLLNGFQWLKKLCLSSFELWRWSDSVNVTSVFGLVLQNADVLLMMVRWLGDIEAETQPWLAGVAYQLCTSSLPR